MNPTEFQQWRYELQAHGHALNALRAVMISTLPQFYDMESLQKRYALSSESVRDALKKHLHYHGLRGKPIRIPLHQVLELDEILRNEVSHG
jgi:hypothetical protein